MDVANDNHSSVAVDDGTPAELELESSNADSLEVLSSKGDEVLEIENPEEILTNIELDLAYSSEKLVNFNVLAIHVATRENDFEAFLLEEEPTFGDSAHTALEFDILSGILDSEVVELEKFISSLQKDISTISNKIDSCEKLKVCEELLEQSLDQLSDIKAQSDNFQRIIWTSGKHDKNVGISESTSLSDPDTKIKMQTTEHQRHILRLLEKSLARELDLEKKLNESKQGQELLNLQLQEELFYVEDEAESVWERSFRAENYSEVLLSTSKELLNRLQVTQFSLNGVTQREESLKSKLQDYSALMEKKDVKLLEQERTIEDLQNNECRSLREANTELEKELNQLKSKSDGASNKVEQLERKLQEAGIRLEHAVASAEASLEKQAMLNSTIKDMDNLITTLKSKVSTAENQIENVQEKCIMLSETNADLTEAISFLRGRIEGLEASLHDFEKQKKATTKDISIRTKFIADLVAQLAPERERLHKQIYLLTKDKKAMQNYLQKIRKNNPCTGDSQKESAKATTEPDISSKKSTSEVTDISGANSEAIKSSTDISENDNMRNIDAWQMNFKYILFPLLALLISAGVAFWFEYQSGRI
ncbi:hypothetical protein LIER_05641 [Lithospermum erythrorhizon]|uniref:WIT1/2 N-terminal helical bundle domain-containing protein n=1 Tax=Lithospermum erythrorhizon TaxID=34254 RepID=A0AAV3P328_LITER